MPYHGTSSTFAAAPTRPLTREERRIWRARAEIQRRAGEITALHAKIGDALVRRVGADGRCDPALETLADDAACSPRTVGEAMRRFRRLGMLTWFRRLVRVDRVVRQTSNAYYLLLGKAPDRLEKPKVSSSMASSARETKPPRSVAQQMVALQEWAREKYASRA